MSAAALLDAVVIGGGLSGLVCARRLAQGGAQVVVLEAQRRVGGRLRSGALDGGVVDLGGAWMTAGQHRLWALAQELEVASFEEPRQGRALLDEPGGLWRQLGRALLQLRAMKKLERLARRPPPGADERSLEEWLAQTIGNRHVRARLALHADLVLAADRSSLSLLHYLSTLGATGGFGARGAELPSGGREHRFAGGAQALALRLAEGLGDRVRLGQQVVAVEPAAAGAEGGGAIVRTADSSLRARRVVLALPPQLAARLAIALPPAARAFAEAARAGAVVKVFASYAHPFWRERGLSGELYSPGGVVRATVDATAPDGPPTLLGFVVGPTAQGWRSRTPEERREAALAQLAAQLGEAAARPTALLEHDWSCDPFAGGCVVGLPPGALAGGARWREAAPPLHFAGTEAAVAWPGYMDGAIEAGERAAAEVLAGLAGADVGPLG